MKKKKVIHLSVESIRTDYGTQMRVTTSEKIIDEYHKALEEKVVEDFPPIVVYQIANDVYVVTDGFHRLLAYKKAGRETIPCEIIEGDIDDAREYACCANQTHGLHRSDEDKRKAVEEFFKIPGRDALSNSEAARRLGLSTPFVKKVRESLGVKASPASHHGAGSEKVRSNDSIWEPTAKESMDLEVLLAEDNCKSDTITVELPTKNPHQFAVALMKAFKPKFLESCAKHLNDLFSDNILVQPSKKKRKDSVQKPT